MKESNSGDDFLRTEITYGIILRADVKDVQAVKKFILGLDDVYIVYQKSSGGKLYIREEEGGRTMTGGKS